MFIQHIMVPALAVCFLGSAFSEESPAGEFKACRSVHLNVSPVADKPIAIYVEVTPLEAANGTYFSASCFSQGYIGMQQVGSGEHKLIFSIWDPVAKGDDHTLVPEEERAVLIQAGPEVETRRFGGEGTGGNSMRSYDWKLNELMKFLVVQKEDSPGFRQIAGYFYEKRKKKWVLLSCWRTQEDPKNLSYASSFVEDFVRNYDSAKQTRRAAFGPYFTCGEDGRWVLAREFKFSGDNTVPAPNVRAEFNDKCNAFTLATGGDIKEDPAWPLFSSKALPRKTAYEKPGADVETIIRAPKLELKTDGRKTNNKKDMRKKERRKAGTKGASVNREKFSSSLL